MSMWVVKKKTLVEFWEKHADSRGPLESWYDFAKRAKWTTPQDVQKDYGDNVMIGNDRAVFNIKGNDYRLVVVFHFNLKKMYIRFIGTHAEYNRIDAKKV